MAKLVWDAEGTHIYETGVHNGVLYPMVKDTSTGKMKYGTGIAWNGLTSVSENPSGADASEIFADNIEYLNLYSVEKFGATIEAYTYPDEFMECDGSASLGGGAYIGQQTRKSFGLCYKTIVGNDTAGEEYGYKIHLIYGCKAAPSQRSYQTINDSPEAISFSWEISTIPTNVDGFKPTATVVLDSTKFTGVNATKLQTIEDMLYGTDSTQPTLPTPNEIIEILEG